MAAAEHSAKKKSETKHPKKKKLEAEQSEEPAAKPPKKKKVEAKQTEEPLVKPPKKKKEDVEQTEEVAAKPTKGEKVKTEADAQETTEKQEVEQKSIAELKEESRRYFFQNRLKYQQEDPNYPVECYLTPGWYYPRSKMIERRDGAFECTEACECYHEAPYKGRKRETPKTKKKKRSGQKRSGQKRKSKDKGAKEPSAKKQKLADGKGKAKDDEAESEAEEAQDDDAEEDGTKKRKRSSGVVRKEREQLVEKLKKRGVKLTEEEEKRLKSVRGSTDERLPATVRLSEVLWKELGLAEPVLSSIKLVRKQDRLTDIQADVIPAALKGTDVVVHGRPETGRTLSYAVPIVNKMAQAKATGWQAKALVITNSVQRCEHIAKEFETLTKFWSVPVATMASRSMETELKKVTQKVSVIVATPMRLAEHLMRNAKFSNVIDEVKFVVLDNLDSTIEEGHQGDLDMVLSQLVDKTRQTMCYSSGPSEAFTKFAEKHTKENRHIVKVYTAQELELRDAGGRHEYIVTPTEKQALVLYNLLQHLEADKKSKKVIVYFNDQYHCIYMRRLMAHLGMSSMMVSNLTNRHNNIEMFDKCEDAWKEEKGRAFVCDVQISKHKFHHLNNLRDNLEDVTTVICMEAPVDMKSYARRLGWGKVKHGIIICPQFQEKFMKQYTSLGCNKSAALVPHKGDEQKLQEFFKQEAYPPDSEERMHEWIRWFYKEYLQRHIHKYRLYGCSKSMLVKEANTLFQKFFCIPERGPLMDQGDAWKMGIHKCPDLRMIERAREAPVKEGRALNTQITHDGEKRKIDLKALVEKLKEGAVAMRQADPETRRVRKDRRVRINENDKKGNSKYNKPIKLTDVYKDRTHKDPKKSRPR